MARRGRDGHGQDPDVAVRTPKMKNDFLPVVIAAAATIASVIRFVPGSPSSDPSRRRIVPSHDELANVVSAFVPAARFEWKPPPTGIELFASTVSGLTAPSPATSLATKFAVEVLAIQPEPFPWRLIGVVG